METVQEQIQNKLKLLFTKVLEPNYVMNNYYVDGLINKLSNFSDPEIKFLEKGSPLTDLMFMALKHINDNAHSTDITVRVFILRVLAVALQKEFHFTRLIKCFKLNDLCVALMMEINSPTINPSLRVAYIEIALAMLEHHSGLIWLYETAVWREIINLCHEKHTIFVVRKSYKFTTKFLWKMSDLVEDTVVKDVVNYMLQPIINLDLLNGRSITPEEEEKMAALILPITHMLLAIVAEERRIEKTNILMSILIKDLNINSHLTLIFDRIRADEVSLLVAKLMIYFSLAKIFLTKPLDDEKQQYVKEDFLELTVIYFNTIQRYLQRRQPAPILDFCYSTILVWASVFKNRTHWRNDESTIHVQLLFICLVPPLVFVKYDEKKDEESNKKVHEIVGQFLNNNCELTTRAAYALRDLTIELDPVSITLQSVKRIYCLKNQLTDKQANFVFQIYFYLLKKYDPLDENGDIKLEESFEVSQEKVLVMTHVLDIVLHLVKNYNIHWTESLEIIGLFNVVYNILKRPNLSCKFIVTALNVIRAIVSKFLTPNMSLLLESKPGSDIHELSKLIYLRLHDIHWEVRDSALELLLVCTEMAYIKFPPFQSQIFNSKLINVAAAMALNDEYYVQASALRCLGAATRIAKLWHQLTEEYPNILETLVGVLRDNPEGIVRKEASNVLIEVYQNLKISNEFKQVLYTQMVSAAISDFHWEVQISALKFWKAVIHGLLTDQGMLDGVFPPVTFSRETRKIDNLNEEKIQKRILKTLDELASIGCLTVLVQLLHEETETDILDLALVISNDFYKILQQYKLPEIIKANADDLQNVGELPFSVNSSTATLPNPMKMEVSEETNYSSDNVIDGIVNVDDLNLLANMYETRMRIRPQKTEQMNRVETKIFESVSPLFFIQHLTSKDFKSVVEQKRQWKEGIRSISSLLDDVLGLYEINTDANALDCY